MKKRRRARRSRKSEHKRINQNRKIWKERGRGIRNLASLQKFEAKM